MDPPPLILPELGFRVELGGTLSEPEVPTLEEVEKHSQYYRDNFCNKGRNQINFYHILIIQTFYLI